MAASILALPVCFLPDKNGVPIAAGQLLFFQSGTSTPAQVYADINLTTPLGSTVTADANGYFPVIFLSPSFGYRVQAWTAATPDNPTGSEIWSADNVGPGAGGALSNNAGIIGEIRDFAGIASAIPAAWYVCAGQAVSRTTYAAAFSVLGTSWGAGDGTTTFNLPDLRGRGTAGLDNMGGTPANRMTSGVAGIAGTNLGATGGNQATQAHTHAITDPGHVHVISDPGHLHVVQVLSGNTAALNGPNPSWVGNSTSPYNTETATTGIAIQSAVTAITLASYGAGNAQNVQPTGMVQKIIYLGL